MVDYITNVSSTAMQVEFNDSQPIYRQLRDRVSAMILDGVLGEGDPLPSVRTVAAEYRVNPQTRRGRGMFVNPGARAMLLEGERRRFLDEQWPVIAATIRRLGLNAAELLAAPVKEV
jgi:GntR family transcriptional regulator